LFQERLFLIYPIPFSGNDSFRREGATESTARALFADDGQFPIVPSQHMFDDSQPQAGTP
jgi:hypothetical protein